MIARINREMDKVLKTPDMVERLAQLGFFTGGAETPEATRAFVQAQYELWGKVVRGDRPAAGVTCPVSSLHAHRLRQGFPSAGIGVKLPRRSPGRGELRDIHR